MDVCKESVLLPNCIPARNEGVLGTSLGRQVEEQPYERSCRALVQPPASNNCVLPEIWQPDPKELLQIFGYKPRYFPTIVLLSSPLCLQQSSPTRMLAENTVCQMGANPEPKKGFVLGLSLGSEFKTSGKAMCSS